VGEFKNLPEIKEHQMSAKKTAWDDDYFREVKEVKDVREPDYDCDLIELNTKRLFCDVCGQGIYGDFYVDKHYGITYCETCSSQQWLDETMASHNYRK